MKDFGKKLKNARETKGFSLELVHSRLKITPYQLDALENMESEKFHATVYFIGSLRRYALFLGIDPNEIINSYTQNLESVAQKSQLNIAKKQQIVSEKKQNNKKPSSSMTLIVIFALTALLVLSVPVAFFIFGKMKPLILSHDAFTSVKTSTSTLTQVSEGVPSCDTVKNISVFDTKENEENITKKAPLDPVQGIKVNLQNALLKRHNQKNYSLNQGFGIAKAMQLKVVGLDNTWVRVISDKKALFEGTINKDTQRFFNANEKFYLKLGNESGVEVYLNGHKIELVSEGEKIDGKVRELELTLKDINAGAK
ncbi:MAG: DUF4115 domain-containing protein [Endomicrobiales bacterium]|nr:DUF4115 domain-containing protein [Endomicrobiales bacterium]